VEIATQGQRNEKEVCFDDGNRSLLMTDSVWISNVLADPDLVLLMETDVVAQDANRAIQAINLLKAGKAVPEGFMSQRGVGRRSRGVGSTRARPVLGKHLPDRVRESG
jgi:hypothetical protein